MCVKIKTIAYFVDKSEIECYNLKRGKTCDLIKTFCTRLIYITEVTLLYIVFKKKKEKSNEGY